MVFEAHGRFDFHVQYSYYSTMAQGKYSFKFLCTFNIQFFSKVWGLAIFKCFLKVVLMHLFDYKYSKNCHLYFI